MASPFPGMDPYLESHWGDVHHSLITYARDQLRERLPGDLRARAEERITVEPLGQEPGPRIPDLRILEQRQLRHAVQPIPAGLVVAEPYMVETEVEVTEGFLQILDASAGHRVVTVLEVLSPSNKLAGEGQVQYLKKRQELRAGGINLVEIDLTRAGKRLLPVDWGILPEALHTTYHAWVWRAREASYLAIYSLPLAARLPVINIPLRDADQDAPLDLQALVDASYRNGGYEDDLDYQNEPKPRLSAKEARWADALLRKAGRRTRSRRAARPNGRR